METLYIGTDLGVFIKDSTINDWNNYNYGSLPNVIVNELEIQYPSNKLLAATFGRGLWSIDLLITSPPIADFSVNDSIFCNVPATVNFTNTSYYSNSYYYLGLVYLKLKDDKKACKNFSISESLKNEEAIKVKKKYCY